MKLLHAWSQSAPLFDDERLVSCAGLAPVMALAEQTCLSELIGTKVMIKTSKVASAAVNPAGKITSIIAGMAAGAFSIDDVDVIRTGGMPRGVRRGVCAGDVGAVAAGVHPRPHPSTRLGGAGASDRAR